MLLRSAINNFTYQLFALKIRPALYLLRSADDNTYGTAFLCRCQLFLKTAYRTRCLGQKVFTVILSQKCRIALLCKRSLHTDEIAALKAELAALTHRFLRGKHPCHNTLAVILQLCYLLKLLAARRQKYPSLHTLQEINCFVHTVNIDDTLLFVFTPAVCRIYAARFVSQKSAIFDFRIMTGILYVLRHLCRKRVSRVYYEPRLFLSEKSFHFACIHTPVRACNILVFRNQTPAVFACCTHMGFQSEPPAKFAELSTLCRTAENDHFTHHDILSVSPFCRL